MQQDTSSDKVQRFVRKFQAMEREYAVLRLVEAMLHDMAQRELTDDEYEKLLSALDFLD